MLEKITQKFKSKPLDGFLFIIELLMVLFVAICLSFCILQSDDYSYAAYFQDGIGNFLKLTKEHYLNINGRALVHFFLQITLALPSFMAVLIKSAVLFSTGFLSFKASRLQKENTAVYLIAFYALILLWGNNTLKETLMWTSGFFNYIFPALLVFLALYFHTKGSKWQYLLFFLSGATTEQWGISSAVIITSYIVFTASKRERKSFVTYLPSLSALLGYITIFLSPATLSRISVSGHATVSESLFDIPRLSKAFLTQGSAVTVIIIFILTALLTAVIKKGMFRGLYSLILPLALILSLPLHHSYMATFITLLIGICSCSLLLFSKKHAYAGSVFMGAAASMLIMLPTNTFDYRITCPAALLLTVGSIMLILELNIPKKALAFSVISLLLIAVLAFYPSFTGFYKNYAIEKTNLDAIKQAKETKALNYCIDYDKNYAMRQMFNDGWFYNEFISLYKLEDCNIYLDSKNAKTLYLDTKPLKAKAIASQGEVYVPLRAFVKEMGGSIVNENSIKFTLNGKTLTYLDGILMYINDLGKEKYLIADNVSLHDFYTLYIKLDVLNTAFNTTVSIDKN